MSEVRFTIEDDGRGGFTVYEHGTWGKESALLRGMPKRSWRESFETLEDAQRAFPKAEVSGSTKGLYSRNPLPVNPPPWFDPADCGEVWHEDDY